MNLPSEKMKEFIENKIAFVKRMGLKVLVVKKGYVKLTAPLKGNENHIGTMYAGAMFSLAELPGGAICWSSFNMDRFYPIVKEMTISFRRPAKTDLTVEIVIQEKTIREIEDNAMINGKADFILEGKIKDASGETVACSKGFYQLRSNKI